MHGRVVTRILQSGCIVRRAASCFCGVARFGPLALVCAMARTGKSAQEKAVGRGARVACGGRGCKSGAPRGRGRPPAAVGAAAAAGADDEDPPDAEVDGEIDDDDTPLAAMTPPRRDAKRKRAPEGEDDLAEPS